jgi:hypothetical protein
MCFLQEKNAYRNGHVCSAVRMFQRKNLLTDLDEIWYEFYVTGGQIITTNLVTHTKIIDHPLNNKLHFHIH